MKSIFTLLCCLCGSLYMASAQELILTMPQKMVSQNETVSIDIFTVDFDSIASVQFSIHWDTSVVAYLGNRIVDLDLVAVGETDASAGTLRVSWFDIEGLGVSLEEGQVFLALDFLAVGEIGDLSPINIDGDPLAIQIFKATDMPFVFDSIPLAMEQGMVEIIADAQNSFEILNSNISDVPCTNSATGSIDLDVNQDDVLYEWAGPDGFVSNSKNIDELIAGEYNLLITDSLGMLLLDTIFTIFQPLSSLSVSDIIITPSTCDADSGSAEIEIIGGVPPYEFILDSGMQFDQNNLGSLAAGSYTLTITDVNDCSVLTDFVIGQLDSLDFSLGEDLTFCAGSEVEIIAGEFASYLWSNGSSAPSITVDDGQNYSVIVTTISGCTASDTVNVEFIESVDLQIAQENIIVCPGDSLILSVNGGVNYEWIDPNNDLEDTQGNSILVQPNEATVYTVISESECGSGELEIPVAVYTVVATAGEDICVPAGETATLQASGGVTYEWSGSEYPLNLIDVANPFSNPLDSTQYFVSIVDRNNCTSLDTVTVFVADDPVSFIPHINMISPNGDGINDEVDFGDINKFGTNNLRVFNRWGKIVYEKLNYQSDEERFSGMFNGQKLPAGNYYYVLSFRNDQKIKQTLCIIEE